MCVYNCIYMSYMYTLYYIARFTLDIVPVN